MKKTEYKGYVAGKVNNPLGVYYTLCRRDALILAMADAIRAGFDTKLVKVERVTYEN